MTLKFTRSLFGAIAKHWLRTAAVAVMALTVVGAGRLFAVARNPCAGFHITPLGEHFSWVGGQGAVAIAAPGTCSWQVVPRNSNGMLNPGDFANNSGTGDFTFFYSVNPNWTKTARDNYIKVIADSAATATQTITQAAYGHN